MLNHAVPEQKCKQWTLRHLVPSNGRVAPLGKYLCALANSFTPEKDRDRPKTRAKGQPREPSARRRRLHILYILNDIFYHVKFREGNDNFADKCEGFLPTLIRSAASFPNCPKHTKKVQDLIALWEEHGYFGAASIAKFRAAAEQALVLQGSGENNGAGADGAVAAAKASKEAPFIMPAMHGDPTMPWYDLPAGNWLPVLEPNSTRPMKPSMVKPLQLAPGPADKTLVEAVNKLLDDVDKLYSTQACSGPYDIDQMGEIIETDEISGDIINGETYYGWSRAFCEKMKARRKKAKSGRNSDRDQRSSRSSSRSSDGRSRSISRGPRFGARDAMSRSRSSSRPGFKRRRSSSDSRSPPRRMRSYQSRNRSRSRTRSRGYRRGSSRSRSRSRSRSPRRSPSLSPDYSPPSPGRQPSNGTSSRQPVGNNSTNTVFNPPPPPFAQQPQPSAYPSHGSYHAAAPPPPFPVPPPPPQNYNGQWPPPPPPPPPLQNFFHGRVPAPPQGLAPPPWSGGWPAPHQHQAYPPQQHPQQQQQGYQPHGQYEYGRGGAGGYQGGGGGDPRKGGWS